MITTIIFYALVFALIVACALMARKIIYLKDTINSVKQELASVHSANPWKSQLMLMLKSGQEVARGPMMTRTGVLYGALLLEEGAETLLALAQGIEETCDGRGSKLYTIARDYARMSVVMENASKAIRADLKNTDEIPRPVLLSRTVVKALLDGVTDVHVVTSGLGLAVGLPGQAGFERIVQSNLSKANPVTGMIDKTADGKWIKGPYYHEPDLDSLLDPYYSGNGFQPLPPVGLV